MDVARADGNTGEDEPAVAIPRTGAVSQVSRG